MLFARIKIIIVLVTSTRIEMTHQLSLDIRRNEPLWLIVAWGSRCESTVTDRARLILQAWYRPFVEPCSIVSLKSGISVTPPNLGSRCIALAKPTIRNKRSSTSQAITCTVGFASVKFLLFVHILNLFHFYPFHVSTWRGVSFCNHY